VVRSGFVEGRHRGSVVALAPDGTLRLSFGDPAALMFPRSASKPLQAAALVGLGLDVPEHLLALAASSHSGEPFQLDGVRALLATSGLSVDALRTPPDDPYGPAAARAWVADGHQPEPVAMNCSGKHAAMLAVCARRGWDLPTYLDPGHPVQVEIRDTIGRLAAEPVTVTGVDGCGAPLFALTLTGLARAVQACVLAPPGSPERRVADAARAHPDWLAGPGRDVTDLMVGVPGLLAKDGAEGVGVAVLADGTAVAVKVDDGAGRARQVVTAEALRRLGVDAPVVEAQRHLPLYGGGAVVGAVRPTDWLGG
jgi:L-asparaginase II